LTGKDQPDFLSFFPLPYIGALLERKGFPFFSLIRLAYLIFYDAAPPFSISAPFFLSFSRRRSKGFCFSYKNLAPAPFFLIEPEFPPFFSRFDLGR